MEALLMILVAVAIGTAVGVGTAWVMTQRKGKKQPSTGVAVLKDQLQNTESALAAAVVASETLKKQIAQRDLNVQKMEEELKSRTGLSEEAVQQVRREAEARAAAAQRASELELQLMKLTEEHSHLERRFNEQAEAAQSTDQQALTAVQAELDGERKFVQELAAESSRIKAECSDLQAAAEAERTQRAAAEAQVEHEREQVRQMAERLAELEAGHRATLEAERIQFETERARHESERGQFEAERGQFQTERAQFAEERASLQAQLQEEKQVSAQGREQLAMVQEKLDKLASVFKAVAAVELPADPAPAAPAPAPAAAPANGNGAPTANAAANATPNGASANGASTNGHLPADAVKVELQIPPATEEETAETHVTVA